MRPVGDYHCVLCLGARLSARLFFMCVSIQYVRFFFLGVGAVRGDVHTSYPLFYFF